MSISTSTPKTPIERASASRVIKLTYGTMQVDQSALFVVHPNPGCCGENILGSISLDRSIAIGERFKIAGKWLFDQCNGPHRKGMRYSAIIPVKDYHHEGAIENIKLMGFEAVGEPWKNPNTGNTLQLFVRDT